MVSDSRLKVQAKFSTRPQPPKLKVESSAEKPTIERYAKSMSKIFDKAEGEFCFGIIGGWGCGKTALKNQLKANLKSRDTIHNYEFVDFSAWKHREAPEMWAYLYESFFAEIRKTGWKNYLPVIFRANILKNDLWISIAPLFLLSLSLFPWTRLVPAFISLFVSKPLIFVFVFFLALSLYRNRHYIIKVGETFFSYQRYQDKIGLDTMIGEDLGFLIQAWINPPKLKKESLWVFVAVSLVLFSVIVRFFLVFFGFPETILVSLMISSIFFSWLSLRKLQWATGESLEQKRAVVAVDDLDRCQPDLVLEVIESIKLFLSNKNIGQRVQSIIVCEGDILKHSIVNKYQGVIREIELDVARTKSRVIQENIDKVFTASIFMERPIGKEVDDILLDFVEEMNGAPTTSDISNNGAPKMTLSPSGVLLDSVFDRKDLDAFETIPKIFEASTYGSLLSPRMIRGFLFRYLLSRDISLELFGEVNQSKLAELLAKKMTGGVVKGDYGSYIAIVNLFAWEWPWVNENKSQL